MINKLTKISNQSQQSNQDIKLKAQSLVLESYLSRMSLILLKEKCYSNSFNSNDKTHEFILQDTVNILKQLQGNPCYQNTVIACLNSFEMHNHFNHDIYFDKVNLKYVKFDDVQFVNASFQKSDLENASFQNTFLEDCSFAYANLTNVNFQDAILKKSDLKFAIIHNTDFRCAFLEDVDLKDVDLSGALNLSLKQVLEADNWQYAKYEPLLQAEINKYKKELKVKTKDKTYLERFYHEYRN